MLVLGIESSRDETGVALYDTHSGLCAHALYSQIVMHHEYDSVMPELASRDRIRRVIPLPEEMLDKAGAMRMDIDAIAYTRGPRLADALLVGAPVTNTLAFALGKPLTAVRHLKGYLLSSLLGADRLELPFLVLLVSGGHTQLIRIDAVGRYTLLGGTLDDAVGKAFDKTTKLLDLGCPDGLAILRLAEFGNPGVFDLPQPILYSDSFDFSSTGLETAVLTRVRKLNLTDGKTRYQPRASLARVFVDAIVGALVKKTLRVTREHGLKRTVVAGGTGVDRQLREGLNAEGKKRGLRVYYPGLQFCTDNSVTIAFADAMRLQTDPAQVQDGCDYGVTPCWDLKNVHIRHT